MNLGLNVNPCSQVYSHLMPCRVAVVMNTLPFGQVHTHAEHMLNVTSAGSNAQEMGQKLTTSEEALKFGTRLHLLSLLLEVSFVLRVDPVCCCKPSQYLFRTVTIPVPHH